MIRNSHIVSLSAASLLSLASACSGKAENASDENKVLQATSASSTSPAKFQCKASDGLFGPDEALDFEWDGTQGIVHSSNDEWDRTAKGILDPSYKPRSNANKLFARLT